MILFLSLTVTHGIRIGALLSELELVLWWAVSCWWRYRACQFSAMCTVRLFMFAFGRPRRRGGSGSGDDGAGGVDARVVWCAFDCLLSDAGCVCHSAVRFGWGIGSLTFSCSLRSGPRPLSSNVITDAVLLSAFVATAIIFLAPISAFDQVRSRSLFSLFRYVFICILLPGAVRGYSFHVYLFMLCLWHRTRLRGLWLYLPVIAHPSRTIIPHSTRLHFDSSSSFFPHHFQSTVSPMYFHTFLSTRCSQALTYPPRCSFLYFL